MRSGPPLPGIAPEIEYPEIPGFATNNGLTVLCVEDHHLPRVSMQLALPVGRTAAPDDRLGQTQLLVDMLKEGTAFRSSQEIAETLDRLAIELETEVSMEHSLISMTMLDNQLEAGLELLSDMVRNPSFPEVEFEKVKTRWQGYLIAQRSDAAFLANERIFKDLFPAHPYSKISIPLEHLDAVDCTNLRDFHRKHFSPQKASLLFAGAIEPVRAIEVARKFFEDWSGDPAAEVEFPDSPPNANRLFTLVHRPHSAQAKIMTGIRTVSRSHPEFIPLKLTNQIYGGGASARLFLNLREEKGYTYGAYSFQRNYRTDGILLATASVRTEVTAHSITEIFEEMDKMRQAEPSDEELNRSKAEIIGSFIRQTETPTTIGSMELIRRLSDLPADYYAKFIPAIKALSPQQVLSTAQTFMDSRRVVTVVVGDRSLIESDLRALGELRIYDSQGDALN